MEWYEESGPIAAFLTCEKYSPDKQGGCGRGRESLAHRKLYKVNIFQI